MKEWIGLKTSAIVLCCHFIVGCATTVSPTPGSEKIKILGAPNKRCKNLGEINTNDVAKESFDSAATLHDMNITLLKNKSLALGANVVVLTNHVSSQEKKSFQMGKIGNKDIKVNTHSMVGMAYYCPSTR
ncbi:MAG: DUF4156 domain-containing protein [Gammaproteobacteria bacterium]|nr:DUF4156 domain-containing protein [Gammaproteobacteria bacterium]